MLSKKGIAGEKNEYKGTKLKSKLGRLKKELKKSESATKQRDWARVACRVSPSSWSGDDCTKYVLFCIVWVTRIPYKSVHVPLSK